MHVQDMPQCLDDIYRRWKSGFAFSRSALGGSRLDDGPMGVPEGSQPRDRKRSDTAFSSTRAFMTLAPVAIPHQRTNTECQLDVFLLDLSP